jgi:mRNA degradation ribonuclease J1/J2
VSDQAHRTENAQVQFSRSVVEGVKHSISTTSDELIPRGFSVTYAEDDVFHLEMHLFKVLWGRLMLLR